MSEAGIPASWQGRLWRASLHIEGVEPNEDLLLALEQEAEAVCVFADAVDDAEEPVSWRLDLYFREAVPPERVGGLLAEAGIEPPAGGVSLEEVPAEDWVKASSAQRGPLSVGRFFVHAAADRHRVPPDAVAIELEAGLAFGSGEHESTRGCLLALDWLARRRRPETVLDLGTGSGILAIAAARLWPCRVVAVDNDPIAVLVARENARNNGVARRVSVHLAEGYRSIFVRRQAPYDLILANVLADPLVAMARDLRDHLAPGGIAVLSGLLEMQADRVERAHTLLGLRPLRRIPLGRWTTLLLRKPRGRRRSVSRAR